MRLSEPKEGRLAAPGRPDQGGHGVGRHVQVDVRRARGDRRTRHVRLAPRASPARGIAERPVGRSGVVRSSHDRLRRSRSVSGGQRRRPFALSRAATNRTSTMHQQDRPRTPMLARRRLVWDDVKSLNDDRAAEPPVAPERVQVQDRSCRGGHEQRCRLTDHARDAQDHRGDDARRAVGSTTRQTVRHSGAPIASEASRKPSGTSRKTTSHVRVTVGSIRIERASAAAKPENPPPRDQHGVDEQAGDDRRDTAHRVDEYPHRAAEPAVDLVQIHRRQHAQRNAYHHRDGDLLDRAHDRLQSARWLAGDEGPMEAIVVEKNVRCRYLRPFTAT